MPITAALALRGNGALLNFPKLAHSLPRLADLSDKAIQAAATIAANNFAQRSGGDTNYNSYEILSSPSADTVLVRDQRLHGKSSSSSGWSKAASAGPQHNIMKSFSRQQQSSRKNATSEEHVGQSSYNVIDSSGMDPTTAVENLQHQEDMVRHIGENLRENITITSSAAQQPMYIDSEDMFNIGPVGLNSLCNAMCIPPPDSDHAIETDGEEGSNSTWEPHLWSY